MAGSTHRPAQIYAVLWRRCCPESEGHGRPCNRLPGCGTWRPRAVTSAQCLGITSAPTTASEESEDNGGKKDTNNEETYTQTTYMN